MSQHIRSLLGMLTLGLLVSTAVGQAPASKDSDLDKLLKLVGQGGVVNNERLYFNDWNAFEKTGTVWLDELDKLTKARPSEVAGAIARLKPVIEMHQQARRVKKQCDELVKKIHAEEGPSGEDWGIAVREFMADISEHEVDELVARGKIAQAEADEYLRLRRKASAEFWQKFAKSFGDSLLVRNLAERQIFALQSRADVLAHQIASEELLRALRARAGAAQDHPPLEVKLTAFPRYDYVSGKSWTETLVNIRSSATTELTKLTLLLEIKTNSGSRRVIYYVPQLGSLRGGRFDPVELSAVNLNDAPKGPVDGGLKIERVRYSVWCDQFHVADLEPTRLSREEMINDTHLLALLPETRYLSQGGFRPEMSVIEINRSRAKDPNWRMPPSETAGRYELVFKQLTPNKQEFDVEALLIDRDGNAKEAAGETYRGRLKLPVIKLDKDGNLREFERVTLKLTAGTKTLALGLQSDDERWTWRGFRAFLPASNSSSADSPLANANRLLQTALKLATDERKYEEARKTYQKLIIDYPDAPQAKLAAEWMGGLDQLKADHQKLDEQQKNAPPLTDEQQKLVEARRRAILERTPVAPPAESRAESTPKSRPKLERPSTPSPAPSKPARELAKNNKEPEPRGTEPATQKTEDPAAVVTRVTVGDVEYVYQGSVRSGDILKVTVLATSKKGNRDGPMGMMTLIDEEGEKYSGKPVGGLGARPDLKEGVPVKLTWQFGGNNAFTGAKLPPPPTAKVKRFISVSIEDRAHGRQDIDFRNVPAKGNAK